MAACDDMRIHILSAESLRDDAKTVSHVCEVHMWRVENGEHG